MTFNTYYEAATAFFAGLSPYGQGFLYSPAFFYFFYPFYAMGYLWGLITFIALGIVLSIWVIIAYWKDLRGGSRTAAITLAVAGAVVVTSANINPLIAIIITLAWRHRKQMGIIGGFCLGLISVKPTLVVCYLLFLWALRGKQLVRVACGTVLGMALVWLPFMSWWEPLLQGFIRGDTDMPTWIPNWFHLTDLIPLRYEFIWYSWAVYRQEKRKQGAYRLFIRSLSAHIKHIK